MKIIKSYPLTCLCVLVIWIICLIPLPETSLDGVPFVDKWTHIAMYAVLTSLFWIEYWRYTYRHAAFSTQRLWIISFIVPILMSGVIELVQFYCTGGNRSGEWLDFFANSLGTVVGLLLGRTVCRVSVDRFMK